MIVEFQATVDDFADITRRSQRRAKSISWTRRGLVIVALMSALAGFALANGSLAPKLEAIGIMAFIFVGVYVFLLADCGPFYKRTIRHLYSSWLGTSWPVRVRVELDEAGITFIQNGVRSINGWAIVEGIQETNDAIYFLTDESVMAVRKRGFKSDADLADFLELAHHHLRPHQNLTQH